MSMLNEEVYDLLNAQITKERENQALYMAAAAAADFSAWDGSRKFFLKSAGEEMEHAQKFVEYIIARNMPVTFDMVNSINPNMVAASSLLELFNAGLEREIQTTDAILAIYQAADEAGDFQTCEFLNWFMKEQTDSVKEFQDIVTELGRTEVSDWPILDEKYGEL